MADNPTYGIVDYVISPLFAWKLAADMKDRFGHEKDQMMHFIFYIIPILGILTFWQDVNTIGAAMEKDGKENNAMMWFILMLIPIYGPMNLGGILNDYSGGGGGGGDA